MNPARAGETNPLHASPRFLGAQSCSSSGCHGGADELSKQFTVWTRYDFHHERPVATLATARSERLASVLKIGNPAQSPRCTACHAPFQTVPAALLAKDVRINEGVSCESCHGPAENWLRSHTRKDYTHADRVTAGMRDLKNPYVRANTCVACHQNVDSDLLRAGHPELIFELDGQCVTQPKHWRKELDKPGAQLWFVGQAVALREMSWQLANEKSPDENQIVRWAGLLWLMQRVVTAYPQLGEFSGLAEVPRNAEAVQKLSDGWARTAAGLEWTDTVSLKLLRNLANTHEQFLAPLKSELHARRAERLVLALDRLLPAAQIPLKAERANLALDRLYADIQSLPDFDPVRFAADLKEFYSRVSGVIESK